MKHPRSFDIEAWITQCPLDNDTLSGCVDDWSATGPTNVAYIEQIKRAIFGSDLTSFASTPVDLFVFAKGEAPKRSDTKIGGLPYRPVAREWPRRADGSPYTFVAQFNFSESRDIIAKSTPGNIMLVFAEREDLSLGSGELGADDLYFEWYDEGIYDDQLVMHEALPKPAWAFVTCYGVRWRTFDICDDLARGRIVEFAEQKGIDMDFEEMYLEHLGEHIRPALFTGA